MSLFSIADLHLSEGADKPMDIFGARWKDHASKLARRWKAVVTDDDTVVIPGDISWAMTLDEAICDLKFIEELPGKKILGKGNHDFWWSTLSKMGKLFEENNIKTISFLQNNAYRVDDVIICGTRGWYVEEKYQNTVGNVDYRKIVNREALRLEASLSAAATIRGDEKIPVLVFFHFPPVFGNFVCTEIIDILKRYEIHDCFFGHIHGSYNIPKTFVHDGISMTIISADYLDFTPMITFPRDI